MLFCSFIRVNFSTHVDNFTQKKPNMKRKYEMQYEMQDEMQDEMQYEMQDKEESDKLKKKNIQLSARHFTIASVIPVSTNSPF